MVTIARRGRTVAHLAPALDQERAARKEAVQRFQANRRGWRRVEAALARGSMNPKPSGGVDRLKPTPRVN